MRQRNYRRLKDGNHDRFKLLIKALNYEVLDLYRNGDGCPDLAVYKSGLCVLVELKGRNGAMTRLQYEFARTWKGCPVMTIHEHDENILHMRLEYAFRTIESKHGIGGQNDN